MADRTIGLIARGRAGGVDARYDVQRDLQELGNVLL